MEELVDVISPAGELTGRTATKTGVHRQGLWHRCFHCWVCDTTGRLLVQRRSAGKKTWPGYLDTTAAGHLSAGEGVLDGLRELEEELGLSPEPSRLIPLGERRIEKPHPDGCDRELHSVFLLFDDTPPRELRLQREEVASVLRLGLDDVQRLYSGERVSATEFTDGVAKKVEVALGDFVPNEDDYLLRVARAALKLLAGGEAGRVF